MSCAIDEFQKHYSSSSKSDMSLAQRQDMMKGLIAQAKEAGKEVDPSKVSTRVGYDDCSSNFGSSTLCALVNV